MNEWSIKNRVLFLALMPTVVISLLLSVYFTSIRIQELEKELLSRGNTLAMQLAPHVGYEILAKNTHGLQKIVQKALSQEDVQAISILNQEGRLLAQSGRAASTSHCVSSWYHSHTAIQIAKTGKNLIFTAPVLGGAAFLEHFSSWEDIDLERANTLGWINIEMKRSSTILKQFHACAISSLIALFSLIISSFLAVRMGKNITVPLLQMAQAIEKIKKGHYGTRISLIAKGELRHLETGINEMASSLQAAHEEMQHSVEQATLDLRKTLETIEMQNVELEVARNEAETASRVKSEFLANMSHEIRTPLNSIIGFLDLLKKTPLSNRQSDYLTTILQSSHNLLTIINDVLDFSKIEAGKLVLTMTPINLRDCIEESLTLTAPAAHEKKLELVPIIYSDVPEKIIGDYLRLKQVITNLVVNAIKFTEAGTVVVRVMLEREYKKNVVIRVSVTDSGIGLTREEQQNLFQAFMQADAKTTRRYSGTGLGLVISKRLVNQMRGIIGVESEPAKGSTFWFTLTTQKITEFNSPLYNTGLRAFHLLLYEPHPMTRLSLQHLVSSWQISMSELDQVSQIRKTLQTAMEKQKPYHALLLTLNLAQAEKQEYQELIRFAHEQLHCKVAILINTTEQAVFDQLQEAGAMVCLTKPVRKQKFHDALVMMLLSPHGPRFPVLEKQSVSFTMPLSILAVDDNPSNLKLVSVLLKNVGAQVDCASSGQEALELLHYKRYDIIFMDIQMPDMDGIEVTKRIRKQEDPTDPIPIVALTAHALSSERERARLAGMNDYLTKPINEKHLLGVLNRWCHQPRRHTPSPALKAPPPLHWPLSLTLVENDETLAKEMLSRLLESLPQVQKKMNQAFSERNYKELREEVHRLHGSCCYCGVPDLKAAAARLEASIVKERFSEIPLQVDCLNKEIQRLLHYLHNHPYLLALPIA